MGRVRVCRVARLGWRRYAFVRPRGQLSNHLSWLWLGNLVALQSHLDQLAVKDGGRRGPRAGTAHQKRKVAKVVGWRRIAGYQILRKLEDRVGKLIRAVDQTIVLHVDPGAAYLNTDILHRRKESSAVGPETPPAFLSYERQSLLNREIGNPGGQPEGKITTRINVNGGNIHVAQRVS